MPSERGRTLLTVGHSTHSIDEFLALLRRGFVETVADVRRFPGSRRSPHFRAERLASLLADAGLGYVGLGELLGGRRRRDEGAGDRGADNSAWENPSFRAYADHMGTTAFASGIGRLESIADSRRTAIMCAEAHPSRCHRRLIADAMGARGWRVFHLLPGRRSPVRHELSDHASVIDGRVTYPG